MGAAGAAGDDAVQRLAVPLRQRAGFCLCGGRGAGVARRERDRRGAGRLPRRHGQERSPAGAGALLAPGGRPGRAAPTAARQAAATANRGANLRGGPGTNYPGRGRATAGQGLVVVGRNAAGDWLRLADGSWIAAFLVDGAPADLAVVAADAQMVPVVEESGDHCSGCAASAQANTDCHGPVHGDRAAAQRSQLRASYPTLCIPIGIGDLDCPDIDARRFPVVGADPHRFDGDHNGIGCERD